MNAIRTENLLARQWRDYPSTHRARTNLLIHAIAVPVFVAANVVVVLGLASGHWILAAAASIATGASLFAQGRGHRIEAAPASPFSGPLDALARLFAEQWLTFPRFVLTGRWLAALRKARVDLR